VQEKGFVRGMPRLISGELRESSYLCTQITPTIFMLINEIFYSLQGEGVHMGKASIFIRLSRCNLRCSFCDTEFDSGTEMTIEELREAALAAGQGGGHMLGVVLTNVSDLGRGSRSVQAGVTHTESATV